ncbi:MAG: hypothetical protein KDA52_10680, partial [Planctomycetaceae bacterium]|nr:hypothetical protein [Planctomycetaceae bacterium]
MRQPFQSVVTLLIVCFVAIMCAEVTQAQPGRGGRGGGRGGDRGLLGTLRSDDVRSELNLTEEQIQQIEELGEQARNFGDNGDLFQRMRDATTDEEREALREEMRSAFEQRRRESDEQLKSILNEQQTTRLQQVSLQQQGLRALGQDEVAESLGLTDDQKSQIKTLVEERDNARRELGFRASEEDRAKFDEEWNTKFAAVLTPQQQQSWQQRLGPPLGSQDGTAATSTAPPQAPAKRAAFEMDVPEGADAVASF